MLCHCVPSYSLFSSTGGLTSSALTAESHFPSLSSSQNRKIYCMDAAGLDSNGREFKTADDMWREFAGDSSKKTQWYLDGVSYWEGVNATVDGVLGGFPNVNEPDISCSEDFLKILLSERFPPDNARCEPLVVLDCGSGIGRVTKNLLIRYFNEVDLLEPVAHFLETARKTLAMEGQTSTMHKAVNFYSVPLQNFTPDAGRYDVIWIQWCIGHLTDEDFISFFKRAKVGLKPGGFFVLKENIARSGFVLDNEDRSVTRSDEYFTELFSQCGLHVYRSKDQTGFPEDLFAVKMYALTTDAPKRAPRGKSKTSTNRPKKIM